jgi:hypothetical protein
MLNRMLIRNSIKMFNYKDVFITTEDVKDANGEWVQCKVRTVRLVKCVTRNDKECTITLHFQDNTSRVISDAEYYLMWRKQTKDFKRWELKRRYLHFDVFFNENCRPQWCTTSIEELLEPFYLDPANRPIPKFFEVRSKYSTGNIHSEIGFVDDFDINHNVNVESLAV